MRDNLCVTHNIFHADDVVVLLSERPRLSEVRSAVRDSFMRFYQKYFLSTRRRKRIIEAQRMLQ